MKSNRLARRIAAAVGGTAIVAMVGLTAACGTDEEKAPETTTTTTTPSSAPSLSPTEKSINPTGGNLFTPSIKAPPAPTAIPGDN
jgi:hypothetical protein